MILEITFESVGLDSIKFSDNFKNQFSIQKSN